MSILPEVNESLMKKDTSRKVTDPTALIAVAKRMVEKVSVEEDVKNRSRNLLIKWRIANLLSAVDETTFFNMVSAGLDGHKKTLANQQPNGDWQPCGYEVEVREVRGEAVLLLGVKWTDQNGGEDVQYQNGAPIVNVTVKTPESNNDEMIALLKMLAAGQLSAHDAIAKLQGKKEEVINEPATKSDKRSLKKRPNA